ncbi:zinc finger, CCHC domain containing 9, isoform CRA_a [Rattus norvegicus]|uniref:Zinc finger, CCHC domain containing 9, isoform CRA_a n=1 Tax=Rattus norvegicus TaxID=10116 RepID=A6I4Q0_RAT|nr:zinc finger, CCHC domain containing 9, isoform CRA_a [Rattus norvegicus]
MTTRRSDYYVEHPCWRNHHPGIVLQSDRHGSFFRWRL